MHLFEAWTWMDGTALGVVLGLVCMFVLRVKWHKKSIVKCTVQHQMKGHVLVYADQTSGARGQEDFGKLLYAQTYDLQGKPDYIYQNRFTKAIVPVELKSGNIGAEAMPHRGDLLQLCAYFLILEEVYGKKPKHGRLMYQDAMFVVQNTKAMRKEVIITMKQMRQMIQKDGNGAQANASFVTCRRCVCNETVCAFAYKSKNT